jgi:hypothetical protein
MILTIIKIIIFIIQTIVFLILIVLIITKIIIFFISILLILIKIITFIIQIIIFWNSRLKNLGSWHRTQENWVMTQVTTRGSANPRRSNLHTSGSESSDLLAWVYSQARRSCPSTQGLAAQHQVFAAWGLQPHLNPNLSFSPQPKRQPHPLESLQLFVTRQLCYYTASIHTTFSKEYT